MAKRYSGVVIKAILVANDVEGKFAVGAACFVAQIVGHRITMRCAVPILEFISNWSTLCAARLIFKLSELL